MRLLTLWIGAPGAGEFAQAYEMLRATTELQTVSQIDDALSAVAQLPPDLIVLPQPWPGCFHPADVDRLRITAPLARMLSLLGTWCAGEGRSSTPLPAAYPMAWHEWPARYSFDLARCESGHSPIWGLPVTSTDTERFLAALDPPAACRTGLVVVQARSPQLGSCLASACRAQGYSALVFSPHLAPDVQVHGISAALWESDVCEAGNAYSLQALAHRAHPAPVVAILDFPRLDDVQTALAAGATAVLAKPFQFNDLFLLIDSHSVTLSNAT